MTTASLSPVFEHLWQSTLFAAAAALLAFALRNNRAHVRYCVWLMASLKFLVPFSLLVAVGRHIQWASTARPVLETAIRQVAQPLETMPAFFVATLPAAPSNASPLAIMLVAIWICGFLAVLLAWSKRWLQIRAAVASAVPLSLETPIPALSSTSLLEPGVFGIFRPILLLPAGIANHLTPEHLQAILAHELCHVRRRDNLAAAIHMLMESLFWFHPLVWWIGARLVEERERACDEEVLRLGNRPQIYADSILKVCQFYLESPLACISGVTGSDLKRRIARIMLGEAIAYLGIRKRLMLAIAAAGAIALPLTVGLAQTPPPSFEIASIKPTKSGSPGSGVRFQPGGRFVTNGITVKFLLEDSYGIKDSQLSGAPAWLDTERYDIDAKPEDSVGAALDKLPPDQRRDKLMQMVQGLLAERFKLELGHDTKELPIYALTIAKNGLKLQKSTFVPPDKPGTLLPMRPGGAPPPGGIWMQGPGRLTSTGIELSLFANVLSRMVGRIIVDKTGLIGRYDFTLQWSDEGQGPQLGGAPASPPAGAPSTESSSPSLFTALQEQLGLKLESQKAPMDILVIKHVEKPTEN